MSKLICVLLLTAFSVAFADQELVDLAQKVLELLNPNSQNQNSILLSLTNGDHVTHQLLLGNSSNSVRVNVTFSGTVSVSAERNTKRVQVSTQYKGGAALRENDKESRRDDLTPVPEIYDGQLDGFVGDLYKEIQKEQQVLAADETAVLLAHGAETGKAFRDNTRRAEAKLKGGFVVGSKTSVKYF